jgi:hypothetical protein
MPEIVRIADRVLDLSHPDVIFLVDCVAELENELANANRYLADCRAAIGALEGEMLIDSIRRQVPASQRRAPPPCAAGEARRLVR